MNLNKFRYAYSRHGISGFTNVLLGKIGLKFRFKTPLERMILYLGEKIQKISKNKILYGIYKNTFLQINKDWNNQDTASKYLGLYELEVQKQLKLIQENKKIKKKIMVNLGAGEGFHFVGALKKKIFNNGIAFESDETARNFLKLNLSKNKIVNFKILNYADENFLSNNCFKKHKLKDCLFLIDIEGGEFKILNNKNLNLLKKSILIIEIHDFYFSPKNLIKKLSKIFKTSFITTEDRNLSSFKVLENFHDNEKWLMVNEGRPKKMIWIICKPK